MIENEIFFSTLPHSADFIFVINVYCHAKRFLHIPETLYFYRWYNESIMRTIRPPEKQLFYWASPFVDFVKTLYELERDNEVLAENPIYCLTALKNNLNWRLNRTAEPRNTLTEENIYKTLNQALVKNSSDSAATLLPFFFTVFNTERKLNDYYSEIIKKFRLHLTARLDIKLTTAAVDVFQIVSVSDDKATIRTPEWIQNGGIGYVVQSYAGNLEIIAKVAVAGKFDIKLRGMGIKNEDNSENIPYWIDYTKFSVNGKVIFDELTPVWHDKSYVYKMKVKADQEIKIQVEWLPHRSDV